jgi:hypothetical protein
LKKRLRHSNRRRKKTVAQRKAAYARCVETASRMPLDPNLPARRDEKRFLMDVLQPFHAAIVKALTPHFQSTFEGEDPADDPPEEVVGYTVDLIYDTGGINDDAIAAAINDIYRNGAEAGLWHVERAI